jgi:formiminotetrahydrofolate cyclodeaminase
MGAKVNLTHEQDQEYLTLLSKNYARLDEQYNEALQQVKDQFEQMLNAGR